MKKTKTKNSKTAKKPGLLGRAAKSLRKMGKGTAGRIGGLSTAQKVVGGAALVALGLNYLAKRSAKASAPGATAPDPADARTAEETLAALDGNA